MALSALAKALINVVMTVASVAYQAAQQRKMKAEADKRKGFEFTVSGESAPLPVVYGKQIIGGVATSRKVTTGFQETSSTEDALFEDGLPTTAVTGTKSEFLHIQYALCQGGIEGVDGILVNGLVYDDAEAGFKHRIRTYNDTLASSPATHEAMGFPATNLFTGAASSTATYRLNRDDYNYNGEPSVQFLMRGRKVRAVTLNAGVYSLAPTFVYSNNPVLVLIDYMTNAEFGRGLPVSKLDLESFYNAAAVCGTVVTSGRAVGGVVNVTALTGTLNAVAEWPLTGVVVGVSGTTLTATGSLFTTELAVGEQITVFGQSRTVTTISSNTSLVLSSTFNHHDEIVYSGLLMSRTRDAEIVTGVGTAFTTELVVGDEIKMGGQTRTVATIASNTRLTVGVEFDVTREYSSAVKPTGTRDIPLYECNITLDTEDTIRGNIERILETMGFVEMMWSPEGRYKLTLDYPTTLAETNALIPSTHVFTDDNILRDEVALSWLSASQRSNQATVNFMNEHEDFKEDSMTWPVFGSAVHSTYLTEDNQLPLKKNLQVAGITDPYHALARAEQEVRKSRQLFTIEFTADKQALSVEIGDLIKLTLSTSGLTDEIFKVNAMEVRADMSVKISAYSFSHEMLAWNVNDDIAYATRPTYDFTVGNPTSVTYTAQTSTLDVDSVGYLSWVNPVDGASTAVITYTTAGTTTPVKLAETSGTSLPIFPRADWIDGEAVTFKVRIKSPLGKMSTGVTAVAAVYSTPAPVTSPAVSESLYQTNAAAGVKARANLSWSHPNTGVAPTHYKVEYYRDEDGSTYAHLGNVTDTDYIFNDVRAGNYHFRVTAVSGLLYNSTPLVFTKEILGLSALPTDPAGLVGKVSDTGILLTWTKPVDLDVLAGGYTQIRYVRNDAISPTWATAQVIVNRVGGSTTTATLPIASGYYLIKHFDSSGNASAGFAQFLNTYAGPNFNVIETLAEGPTFVGAKTNCTVVGSNLELSAGVTSMTYVFANSIDLGSVESVRLVPTLSALITDGASTVADYTLVSGVARFSGPIVDGAVSFEVRHTDDNPAGTPTWSDWETFTVGNYRHRGFEFRLVAVVGSTTYTVVISELSLTADKEDTTKRGSSTSSASVNTTVTFATPFYSGIGGTDVPYVGINTVGGSSGDTVNIVSTSATAFVYSVYNAGARVARTINWAAVGQ